MKKRRIKKSVIKKGIFIVLFLVIVSVVIISIKVSKYHKTYDYKLKQVGYSKEEISLLKNEPIDNIEYALGSVYNGQIIDFINEKYYISSNLQRYLSYKEKNSGSELKDVVAIVNVNRDYDEYTETKKSDIDKNELILVNKYNYLDKDFKPDDVIDISSRYAYAENQASSKVLDEYIKMFNDAEAAGIKLVISSSYRDYDNQDETYNEYLELYGEDEARKYASLPGYSEHQTGLAFDILTLGVLTDDFDKTEEFKWLRDNSYKYGFILRYPKDKENITGYSYESWHYRYVGVDVAKKIHDEGITFDEYYAYYVER